MKKSPGQEALRVDPERGWPFLEIKHPWAVVNPNGKTALLGRLRNQRRQNSLLRFIFFAPLSGLSPIVLMALGI
jgi:hypothetical protein